MPETILSIFYVLSFISHDSKDLMTQGQLPVLFTDMAEKLSDTNKVTLVKSGAQTEPQTEPQAVA